MEIISEDSVLKWYREAHSPKGKMHFLEKMRPFIEWLANAEEGKKSYLIYYFTSSRAISMIKISQVDFV